MDRLQAHIRDLADELGCVIQHSPRFTGMMYVEEKPLRLECLPVTDLRSYYINLHELGHVAHNHTQGRPPYTNKTFYFKNGVLRSEAEAWAWAFDHAKEPLPPDVAYNLGQESLLSYYHHAYLVGFTTFGYHWGTPTKDLSNGNRHWHPFAYGEPDDLFWSVLARFSPKLVSMRPRA